MSSYSDQELDEALKAWEEHIKHQKSEFVNKYIEQKRNEHIILRPIQPQRQYHYTPTIYHHKTKKMVQHSHGVKCSGCGAKYHIDDLTLGMCFYCRREREGY